MATVIQAAGAGDGGGQLGGGQLGGEGGDEGWSNASVAGSHESPVNLAEDGGGDGDSEYAGDAERRRIRLLAAYQPRKQPLRRGDRAAGMRAGVGQDTPMSLGGGGARNLLGNTLGSGQDTPTKLDSDSSDTDIAETIECDDRCDPTPEPAPPTDASVVRDTSPSHTEACGEDLYVRDLAMRRDGGRPGSRMESQQRREPTPSNPSTPTPPRRKRAGPPAGADKSPPKRVRLSSRLAVREAREAREAAGSSARSGSHRVQTPRRAFPLHYWNKQWEVQVLHVIVQDDGDLVCKLQWAPTTVPASTLSGPLLERVEQLVKRDHDPNVWEDWLEMQGRNPRGGK